MISLVPSIVEVLMNKIPLWISNRGKNWTAKSAMMASNDQYYVNCFASKFLDKGPHQYYKINSWGYDNFEHTGGHLHHS